MRILLVEDEPILRRSIRRFLERHGHEVSEAQGALDAIELLGREAYHFQLAIIDYELGTTLTGLDVAKHTELGTERILLTGHDPASMRPKVENPLALFRAILGKPWQEAHMLAVLARVEQAMENTRP